MFSGYEISLAKKNVMARDLYIQGAEDLEEAMPDLIIKMVTRLSEENGGNLGQRATFNGVKANISWCIGYGVMQLHDNYVKPLTGFYVNAASVSAGKTLDKNMHEEDINAVSENVHKLQRNLEIRLARLTNEECKSPVKVNPISNPGSMPGLEADLHENKIQILLSDEQCRTMDNLTSGSGGDAKAVTKALAPLVDLEACKAYYK